MNNNFKIVFISLVFLASALVIFSQEQRKFSILTSTDGSNLIIKGSDLTKEGKFFAYKLKNGRNSRFFAILDSSSTPHFAFDACDVCYQANKGYRISNNFAVCSNCGNKFAVSQIGKDNTAGGCWPSFLPVKTVNGNIIIKISDLEQKGYLFPR